MRIIPFPSNHHGFTLIEILVTLLVVAIGLLGLAGLQVTGLRSNLSAESRSLATLLANDIIERMRANPAGVDANLYTAIYANGTAINCNARPNPFCSNFNDGTATGADACTPAQLAAFDTWVWYCGMPVASDVRRSGISNWLTNGTATVICPTPCAAGTAYQVTVTWDEVVDTDTPTATQSIDIFAVP